MKTKFLFLLMLVVMPFGFAKAEPMEYTFDQTHSQVLFFVSHLGFSYSEGEFQKIDGIFTFDEDEPEKSFIDISIPISSLDMDDSIWESHMRGSKFFNEKEFPRIAFKSTDISVAVGDKTAKITGDLTLHGVTRSVVLDVTFNRAAIHAISKDYVAGFSGSTHIKRSDFGMTNSLSMVGDDIEIRLEIEAIRQEKNSSFNN